MITSNRNDYFYFLKFGYLIKLHVSCHFINYTNKLLLKKVIYINLVQVFNSVKLILNNVLFLLIKAFFNCVLVYKKCNDSLFLTCSPYPLPPVIVDISQIWKYCNCRTFTTNFYFKTICFLIFPSIPGIISYAINFTVKCVFKKNIYSL